MRPINSHTAVRATDTGREDRPLRLGCDVCQLSSVREMIEGGEAALERLFSPEERAYAMATARPEQHLAGIFAAKEALAKALRRPALLGAYYREVTVEHREDGSPTLVLSDALSHRLRQIGLEVVDVSMAHDGDYAIATVLLAVQTTPGSARRNAAPCQTGAAVRCTKCLLSLEHLASQRVTDVLVPVVDAAGGTHYLCPACLRGW